ncbi:hypothetical protein DFH94DRAFT_777198 [Russula ochroleuca]|uniref:J domain-containing protein n=1 Tax=Russula ochroleuca TaxID=152965 RepID=A0A9P5JWE7_9AGAM|nr:hypothetical protein DFH94DRAFT_777198 [Russula ochroleuca]
MQLRATNSQLHHLTGYTRLASTSHSSTPTPFPFPAHRNPTPYQIFHLPSNASQAEIKARYYELARTFHPDSPASQALPSSVRHTRFHAVTRAYDILRGRSNAHLGHGFADDVYSAELARRRRQHAHRHAYYQRATSEGAEAGGADDAWKDQVIIIVGLASIAVGFAPALLSLHTIPDARHRAASANLAQARAEARTFGNERRAAIRARVAEFERNKGRDETPS